MKGPSSWTIALISPLLTFLQKPFGIVVTDRRVLVVRLAMKLTGYPPAAIDAAYPRASTKTTFKHGPLTGQFTLEAAGAAPMKLSIQMIYIKDAEAVNAAVSSAMPAAAS